MSVTPARCVGKIAMWNKAILALAGSAVVVAATLFVYSQTRVVGVEGSPESLAESGFVNAVSYADDQALVLDALTQLREELGRLRERYQSQQPAPGAANSASMPEPVPSATTRAVPDRVETPLSDPPTSDRAGMADFQELEGERNEREQTARIASQLEYQFSAEASDGAWAPFAEETIQVAVQQGDFTGTELLAISCQSTLCRMELYHDNVEAERSFVTNFTSVLDFAAVDAFYQRVIHNNGSIQMTLYLSRDGYQLPLTE